jgi:hypothetical protein
VAAVPSGLSLTPLRIIKKNNNTDAVRLKMRAKETNEQTKEEDGYGKSREQYTVLDV